MATTVLDELTQTASDDLTGTSQVLNQARELFRQQEAKDDKFFKSMLYYFELRVPDSVQRGRAAPFLFPLAMPPESYSMSEPFSISKVQGNRGGFFIEEQGIVARTITLSGKTGWKPRPLPIAASSLAAGIPVPDKTSFYRTITRDGSLLVALSGQRHFQLLQDTVFRTYADLKQDPATSEGTELYFHSLRDDESWRVFPERFVTTQDKSDPMSYRYDIEMTAVAPTDAVTSLPSSEDAEVLNVMRDFHRSIKSAMADVQSVVIDFGEISGTIERDIKDWALILSSVTAITDEVNRFIVDRADAINIPLQALQTCIDFFAAPLEIVDAALSLGLTTLALPEKTLRIVLNGMRRMQDGLTALSVYPELYVSSLDRQAQALSALADLASRGKAALEDAEAAVPTSAQALTATSIMPGSRLLAENDLGLGKSVPRYTSAVERVVEQGDTLTSLASRFLGDAKAWKYIALLNDLVPPYITSTRQPRTLWVGDTVLIPSFSRATKDRGSPVVLGAALDSPAADQLLGTDFALEQKSTKKRPGWVIDPDSGNTDFKTVSGVPNLVQAIQTRLRIDKGSDQLYTKLGSQRVVGLGIRRVDLETVQFRIIQAVQEDPRIASVRKFNLKQQTVDSLLAEMDAEVRGLARPEKIIIRV